jgi:hypothetical protein
MVIMNSADAEMAIEMSRYSERIGNATAAKDVITDATVQLENLKIRSKSLLILQLN